MLFGLSCAIFKLWVCILWIMNRCEIAISQGETCSSRSRRHSDAPQYSNWRSPTSSNIFSIAKVKGRENHYAESNQGAGSKDSWKCTKVIKSRRESIFKKLSAACILSLGNLPVKYWLWFPDCGRAAVCCSPLIHPPHRKKCRSSRTLRGDNDMFSQYYY